MQRKHVGRLLVVDDDGAVGVIAISDLVANLAHGSTTRATVADVMSRGLVVCREDTPISAVARAMHERHSRSIIVVDQAGKPLGVVTGHDVLDLYENREATGLLSMSVSHFMHAPMTIAAGATLREAADLMLSNEVHRLIVGDPADPDGMPLGLISRWNIVAEMAEPTSIWRAENR